MEAPATAKTATSAMASSLLSGIYSPASMNGIAWEALMLDLGPEGQGVEEIPTWA